ncbi:hypothetical protein SLEP1_g15992 [Rubroshorea leprosula]|uniref:Uncharacterized protein n=1 Tax=Rubroshorea leprosula TaxID=152421 RepID=A0AAV5J104_9ROSI|nr:hypothetical protein SLEP1_g15992 [Rubroshorea leprosula]
MPNYWGKRGVIGSHMGGYVVPSLVKEHDVFPHP